MRDSGRSEDGVRQGRLKMRFDGLFFLYLCLALFFHPVIGAADDGAPFTTAPPEKLTLDEAVDSAVTRNPAFRIVQAQRDSAIASLKSARSGYYPQASGSITRSYSEQSRHGASGFGSTGSSSDSSSTSYGLSVDQLIYDFGRRAGSVEQSRYDVDLADLDMKSQMLNIAWGTVSAYLQWLDAEHSVQVRVEGLTLAQKHLASAQAKLDVGQVSPLDVSREKSNVASAESSLIAARNKAASALEDLKQIMGIRSHTVFRPDEPETFLPETIPDESALIGQALADRPDFAALQIELKQRTAQIRLARSQYYPNISGGAQASFSGDQTPLDRSISVSAGIRITLFDGFDTRAGIQSAEALAAMTQAKIDQLDLEIRNQVVKARTAMIDAEKREAAAREALEYAKESLDLAEGRYDAGLASELERADALQNYLDASDSLYQAHNDRRLAWTSLNQAIGQSYEGTDR